MESIDMSSIRKPLPRKTSSRRYSLEYDSSSKYNNYHHHHSNSTRSNTPSPLIKLAISKQFDKIESLLRTKETDLEQFLQYSNHNGGPTDLQTLHQSMTTEDTARNSSQIMMMQSSSSPAAPTTPLHQLLEHRPPYSVVSLLCRVLNNQNQNDELRSNSANGLAEFSVAGANTNPARPEDSTDENGRKPLHIACEYGCDYNVVKRLLKGASYARPFMTCDSYGKLPLHYACANPRGTSKVSSFFVFSSSNKKGIDNMIHIIECLVHAYPRGVIVKDEFGKTPIDIATENRADPRILDRLQQALEKVKASTNAKQQQQQQQQQQQRNQHHHESARRQERRRSLTTTATNHTIGGGGATVTPSVATSTQSIYTSDQHSKNHHSYTTNHHYHRNHRRNGRTKQRIVLNDQPIDLDKEMEKVYNNNELEYYTGHHHQHQLHDNPNEMPSLINFIIECDLTDKAYGYNDDDDDVSSLGVDGISKHERKFQPFTNITDLVDI